MRILGLDVGEKRVGVAVTDALGISAQGVATLNRKSDRELLDEIDKLLSNYEAEKIIVGLPLSMDGAHSAQTELVIKFKEKLAKRFKKRAEVILWDERLSTAGAERTLLEADLSRAKRRKVIDKMAAVFILQGYLQAQDQYYHEELP